MPAYSESNDDERWEADPSKGNKRDASNRSSTKILVSMEDALPHDNPEQGKRRKRSLAKKVKRSVTKPAKAVGRRVFRKSRGSKVEVMTGQEIAEQSSNDATDSQFEDQETAGVEEGRDERSEDHIDPRRLFLDDLETRSSILDQRHRQQSNADAVRTVEGIARNAVLLCGACLLGASNPEWSVDLSRALEFILTAWVTCLVILAVGWWKKRMDREQLQPYQQQKRYLLRSINDQKPRHKEVDLPIVEESSETTPLIQHHDLEETDLIEASTIADIESGKKANNCSEEKPSLDTNTAIPADATNSGFVAVESNSSLDDFDSPFSSGTDGRQIGEDFEHPKLANVYCIDTNTSERIQVNTFTPYRISNELMDVVILAMVRTTNDPSDPEGTATNDKVLEHFSGKRRQFEFQFQLKLKKKPVGKRLYFACDLEDPIKMGVITKAFASAAMAFVKSANPTMHYNLTGCKTKASDGKYETPHIAFTAEGSLDRFVVTKPGEIPPNLGSQIYEDPKSMKKRKTSGELTDWNTEDTYTFSIWSSYADFLEWKIQNLPGIKPFGLQSVVGAQAINLSLYLIDIDLKEDKHYRKDITQLIRMEVSNGEKSSVGKMAKEWIDNAETRIYKHSETLQGLTSSTQPTESIGSLIRPPKSQHVDESPNFALATTGTIDEIDEVDVADAAELGEGIYLRSGDSVLLREFLSDYEDGTAYGVTNGGKFAVLSKQNAPIVIEKTKGNDRNKLIKSGDTVMFKLIQNKAGTDDKETRYLTIHRGWWLKWSTTMPSKNGYFTIFTHETELNDQALPTDETQSSFLTLGGSFSLRHKRWARYAVGISSKPSTDFGGRMLSLYDSKHDSKRSKSPVIEEAAYQSDDEADADKEMPSIGESGYIKPLVLCTQDPHGFMGTSPKSPAAFHRFDNNGPERAEPRTPKGLKLQFSSEHSRADIPAWIEILDRKHRVRQLAYVVRIIHRNPEENTQASHEEDTFFRLKCGKEMARIMKIGKRMRLPSVIASPFGETGTNTNAMIQSRSYSSFSKDSIADELDESESYEVTGLDIDEDEVISPTKDETDASANGDCESVDYYMSDSSSSPADLERKHKRLRKLKKLGKKTVSETKNLATSIRTGKLPRNEPKKRSRDPPKGISKKMKKLQKIEAKYGGPPVFIAGELCATEQARRTASRVLERMSGVPMESPAWQRCNDALSSQLGFTTDQDAWFLDGDAIHLGIKPSKKRLMHESVIARCLWESHWREEWCGIYESSLSFFVPLAKSACHEISYSDITLVRELLSDVLSPLPGFSVLVIETAWQCQYMAFRDKSSMEAFAEKIIAAQSLYNGRKSTDTLEEEQLQKARFWRGFQTLSEPSLAAGASKWAKVSSNQKMKERAILNGRRMPFDALIMSFGSDVSKVYKFVENLLTTSLTFSYTTLEKDPQSFIEFLDRTSELRFLPLGDIDLSSPHAFCMFINIYHCLLQQALLLSVNGPLHKKTISNFMRTSCYEIGGDIFSLAELHSCVIRGKMSKPANPKPPYIDAPKKSNAYKYYALDYTDVRVNFVLNTADMGSPATVPVLTQRYIDQQLNAACADFLGNKQLLVDSRRRIITLPKVCEIYRNDFSNSAILRILSSCMCEMDGDLEKAIREVVEKGEKGLTIRFQQTQEQYYSSLRPTTAAKNNQGLETEYFDVSESNS